MLWLMVWQRDHAVRLLRLRKIRRFDPRKWYRWAAEIIGFDGLEWQRKMGACYRAALTGLHYRQHRNKGELSTGRARRVHLDPCARGAKPSAESVALGLAVILGVFAHLVCAAASGSIDVVKWIWRQTRRHCASMLLHAYPCMFTLSGIG